jgi:hypothetical protein
VAITYGAALAGEEPDVVTLLVDDGCDLHRVLDVSLNTFKPVPSEVKAKLRDRQQTQIIIIGWR